MQLFFGEEYLGGVDALGERGRVMGGNKAYLPKRVLRIGTLAFGV